jgi:hypothetical protein
LEAEPTSAVIGWGGVAEGEGGWGGGRPVCWAVSIVFHRAAVFHHRSAVERHAIGTFYAPAGLPVYCPPSSAVAGAASVSAGRVSERCFVPCIKQGLLVLRSNLVVHYRRVKYPLSWPRP